MKRNAAILLALCMCQGCATSNVYPTKKAGQLPAPRAELTVFVTNPELQRECDILRRSGIVHVTKDSRCPNKVTLTAYRPFMCGQGAMASLLTLGLIPISGPQRGDFRYMVSNADGTETKSYRLPVHFRLSVWEWMLRIFHSNEKVLAEALALAVAEEQASQQP